MEPQSTPAGEQPLAPTPTPDAGAQPQAVDIQATIGQMISSDPTAVLALLDGKPNPSPAIAQAPPAEEIPTGAQPEPEPIQAEPIPEAKHATRIRLTGLSEADQKLAIEARALVADGKATSFFEAIKSLSGEQPPVAQTANQVQAEPIQPEAQPEAPATVSELENLLTNLESQWKEAKADYDTDKEADLHLEILRTHRLINKAEQQAQSHQVEVQSYVTSYKSAAAEVEQVYADAFDSNPAFETILDALKTKAEVDGDPRTKNPRFIVDLAAEAAAMLGIQVGKTAAQNTRRTATPPPAPPARAARPVGSTTAPAHNSTVVPTQDQILQSIKEIPTDQLAQLLDTVGMR